MKIAGLILLLTGAGVVAQSPTDAFSQQRKVLQSQAKAAFDREIVREKAGDCPDATTTYDIVMCLSKANQTTDANYQAYAGALRAMLSQKNPYDNGPTVSGPTGKPATQQQQLAGFDQVQTAWAKYRDAVCQGVDGLYRGGTIVNIEVGGCQLAMVRSHMRDLEASYGEYLSH